ncbi:TRAP transporter substrate-binding protein [Desulfovermiculus halophilus]|jgi:TRAP-type C4-dicarboxylate transport system substrate-binding protein|uniref:TRAP transporter substrate-binding protein n=1 Tax=Desulfovermiculus halophilus TaxID=339722 RepID=UPI00055624F2|nr:TRAP transporter substrate-binding protein [Desulfovermiculus halophilus]
MKKTAVCAMLLGAWIVGLCIPGTVWAGSHSLTYSSFFPPSHVQSKLAKAWCEEVKERTGGKVSIYFYPGQTLTKADQTYDGVVTGRSDIGMSCLLYTRGRFPLMDVINLPFGNPSGEFATAAFNELYDKFQPNELSDVKVLYLHAHGPGLMHTVNTKVSSLGDLKGLKLRCPGSVAETVKALGAVPVTMPMPEVYQALQKGVVDGAVYPLETHQGWKMGEAVDFTTANYSTAYSVGFFVVMNSQKWNALPAEIQETIEEINAEWAVKHGKAWDRSDMEGVRFTLRAGNSILGQGPKEADRWAKAVQPVFDSYIQMTEDKGVPGEEALSFLRQCLEKYRQGDFDSQYME